MNKQLKFLSIVMLFVALVMTTVNTVSASATDYQIERVDVDGTNAWNIGSGAVDSIEFERGETISVEVWVRALTNDANDLKVSAEINGYEYDDIEDVTKPFDIEGADTVKRKVLTLKIPEDIGFDNENSDSFTLRVRASTKNDDDEANVDLVLSKQRDSLNLIDVIFNPSLSVEAGKTLFSSVRLENLGAKKQEDIKVTMSIPELGLSTRTYIDELVSAEDDNNDDEETSASTEQLFLKMPENVKSGVYELVIDVDYNRGHDSFSKSYNLNVRGQEVSPEQEAEAVISIDTTSQNIEKGEGAVYKLSFANLGSKAQTYSVGVTGTGSWGTARVDPSSILVLPNGAGEMYVFVSANENADLGTHFFTVTINAGDQAIKQINLKAEVTGASAQPSDYSNIRKGLEIGFLVLLIILVILGLVLAGKKLGGNGKEEYGEPGTNEKSYY